MHVFIHIYIYTQKNSQLFSSSASFILISFTSPPSNLPAKDMLTMAAGWCSIILAPFLDLSVLRCAIKIPKAGFWKQPPESYAGFTKKKFTQNMVYVLGSLFLESGRHIYRYIKKNNFLVEIHPN